MSHIIVIIRNTFSRINVTIYLYIYSLYIQMSRANIIAIIMCLEERTRVSAFPRLKYSSDRLNICTSSGAESEHDGNTRGRKKK